MLKVNRRHDANGIAHFPVDSVIFHPEIFGHRDWRYRRRLEEPSDQEIWFDRSFLRFSPDGVAARFLGVFLASAERRRGRL